MVSNDMASNGAAPTDTSILVVEDESAIRIVWERFMERWGLQADMARNGQEALEMARAHPYALVITDLTMPVLTGQQLVHTLKKEQPNLEIIVTTGQGTIEIAVEMMKAGVYDFLTKPVDFTGAEFIIRKGLEKARAQAENVRLRQINRDLEELNKIKEKFIAITNHELRTPVSVIRNVVEILSPLMEGQEEETLFRMIASAAEHLKEIVEEMHEVSQISLDKMHLQPSRFALLPLCQEIQEELGLTLKERRHTARWNVPDQLSVRADRVKIKKVLRELLHNAIKFTPDGGEIGIDARTGAQGELVLKVRDTGIGIPPDESEKIFQLFYEVGDPLHHHTSKGEYLGGGMGVGLAIVSDIVRAHHGTIALRSEVNQGSEFTVTLPQ